MRRSEFCVRGPLADTLLEVIRSRFGDTTTRLAAGLTTVVVDNLDPAAERAVLTLLWDTGHDVVSHGRT